MSEFYTQLLLINDKLNHYALRLTADEEEAKDLLQETYLKALINSDKFEKTTNLDAWAYTIMRNTFINNYRRNVRQSISFTSSNEIHLLSRNEDAFNATPDTHLLRKEIMMLIEQLNDEFKEPLKLYIQGYKYKEIAQILGIKMGTVKSRIFFTRKKLSIILLDYCGQKVEDRFFEARGRVNE